MLEVLPSPDHVAALKLSGRVNREDYDRIVAELDARLSRHDRIGVLLDVVEFEDLTLRADAKDAGYGLRNLWELKCFPREAIVTDKEWLRALVSIARPIVPHVEIRTFDPGARGLALSWVSDIRG
jgi:hypothetical protein